MVDHTIDKIGPQLAKERETYYSTVYERTHATEEKPSRFEEYMLSQLNPPKPTETTTYKRKRQKSKQYVITPDPDTYVGSPNKPNDSVQLQFKSWSRTHSRNTSTQVSSRQPFNSGTATPQQINSGEIQISRRHQTFISPFPSPRVSTTLNSPTNISAKKVANGIHHQRANSGVTTVPSSSKRNSKPDVLPLQTPSPEKKNSSIAFHFPPQSTGKFTTLSDVPTTTNGVSINNLEDSEVERHMAFVRNIEYAIKHGEPIKEPIDEKIRQRLETPAQEELFLHLKRTLFQSETARKISRPNTRNNTSRTKSISNVTPSAQSKHMEYALQSITEKARMKTPEKCVKKERSNSEQKNGELKGFPDWIKQREEFKKAYSMKVSDVKSIVPLACEKNPFDRTHDDKILISNWIGRVAMFRSLPSQIHHEIAGKLSVTYYNPNDIICKQGQPGDCLYIIYEGIVDVYVNGNQVATYKDGEAVGRQALETAAPRNATLISKVKSSILTLGRSDYQSIMLKFINQEKQEYLSFLRTCKFFKDLSESKLALIATNLVGKFFYQGDVFYKKGDKPETFYIVKEGKASIETNVELEKANKWPVGLKEWRVKKTVRTVVYTSTVEAGGWFGEIEIIRKIPRINKVTAITDCHILYINANKFFDMFDNEELRRLKVFAENKPVMNIDVMQDSLFGEENTRRQMANIMIDAINSTMKNKTPTQLERYHQKRVVPQIKTAKGKLQSYLKKTTVKVETGEEIVKTIVG